MSGGNMSGRLGPSGCLELFYRDDRAVGTASDLYVTIAVKEGQTAGTPRLRVTRAGFPAGTGAGLTSDVYAGPGRKLTLFYADQARGNERTSTGGIYSVALGSEDNIKSIRISDKSVLNSVSVTGQNSMRTLDVSGSPKLTAITAGSCQQLRNVNASNCPSLTNINMSGCARLETFSFSESVRSKIASLTLYNCPSFIDSIDFRGMVSLSYLFVNEMYVGDRLDLRDSVNLAYADLGVTKFREVYWGPGMSSCNASGSTALRLVDTSASSGGNYIYYENCSNLETLIIPQGWEGANGKATIDVSGCNLSVSALTAVLNNLGEGGNTSYNYIDIGSNPGTTAVQATQAYTDAVNRGWYIDTGPV